MKTILSFIGPRSDVFGLYRRSRGNLAWLPESLQQPKDRPSHAGGKHIAFPRAPLMGISCKAHSTSFLAPRGAVRFHREPSCTFCVYAVR